MYGWIRPWLFLPLALGLLSAAQVWLSYLRYDLSLEMQRITAERQGVAMESSKLRLEVASLTRPERLRRLARTRLGMAPPGPMQVIHP